MIKPGPGVTYSKLFESTTQPHPIIMTTYQTLSRAAVFLVLSMVAVHAPAAELLEIDSAQSGDTRMPSGKTKLYSETGKPFFIGKNHVGCFRFTSVPVPANADIEDASLGITCENCNKDNLRFSVCGEYTQPSAELSETDYNMSDRTWARGCTEPNENTSAAPGSFTVAAALQDIVENDRWENGNAAVFCFVDMGSKGTNKISPLATLTATYTESGGGGGGGDGGSDCWVDTNSDGHPDLDFADTDDDGYCEFAPGLTRFVGTLVFDRPFEIMGAGSDNGATIVGARFRLVGDGEIISDLQSPIVTTDTTGTSSSGLVLQLSADTNLSLLGGLISNMGSAADEDNDVELSTTRDNAEIIIDGPAIVARNADIESMGSINIKGQTVVYVAGNVNLLATSDIATSDINVRAGAYIDASGRIKVENASSDGLVVLEAGAVLSADVIDFCGVEGMVDDQGATLIGSVIFPEDSRCTVGTP